MGFIVMPKPMGIYGTLLHVYPQSFRKRYGPTMTQTLEDLLTNERTRMGRLRIWAITLVDMPFSAAKEHITDGKEISVSRNIKLLLSCTVATILIVGAGSFWFGILHARSSADIEQVTVAQLGDAMQQDGFYSQYGNSTLLFSAKVASVSQGDTTSVTFASGHPYRVMCQFNTKVQITAGQTIAVAAPGGKAERLAHGVLLRDCVKN